MSLTYVERIFDKFMHFNFLASAFIFHFTSGVKKFLLSDGVSSITNMGLSHENLLTKKHSGG